MARFIELTEVQGPRRLLLNVDRIIAVQEWIGIDEEDDPDYVPHGNAYVETEADTFSVFETVETMDQIAAMIVGSTALATT